MMIIHNRRWVTILLGVSVVLAAAGLLIGQSHASAKTLWQAATPAPFYNMFFPSVLRGKEYVAGESPTTTSYYMHTLDANTLQTMGCKLGARDKELKDNQDNLVILDFCSPLQANGQYGTTLCSSRFANTEQIASAVQNYGVGYYLCSGDDDRFSRLRIAVGTTNYPMSRSGYSQGVTFEHGQAWALMINDINDWFARNGYSQQVLAVGATDIELAWNSYTHTREWMDGYNSANWYELVNFGALDGCPYGPTTNLRCATAEGYYWPYDQVWYMMFGSPPVYSIPEIYLRNGVQAKQWAMLSNYSLDEFGFQGRIYGVLTQYYACNTVSGGYLRACNQGGTYATDNTPSMAWDQMVNALKNYSLSTKDLRWSTDIKWAEDDY